MRLTLMISSLRRGGAERTLSLLANSWADQGNQVTLLSFDGGEEPAYPLHPQVKHNSLHLLGNSKSILHGFSQNFSRIRALRNAIRESRPDIVVSFIDTVNVLTLLATRGLGAPVVVCEQTDPSAYDIGMVWAGLRRIMYSFADVLVCPANSILVQFTAVIKVAGCCIPNIFPAPPTGATREEKPSAVSGKHVLVAMGRLVPEKGFDLLLSAFARVANRYPDWSLKILGGGPLRDELQEQAEFLNLTDRIHFAGSVAEPFLVLRECDLFVLSSRVEGFPLSLCEAMACGLPVLSFDCPSGPRDIIRHGVDGILVPPADVDALAGALDRLMGNAQERRRLASRAPEVLTRFSRESILLRWQEIFGKLVTGNHRAV